MDTAPTDGRVVRVRDAGNGQSDVYFKDGVWRFAGTHHLYDSAVAWLPVELEPLDPRISTERLARMLQDAGLGVHKIGVESAGTGNDPVALLADALDDLISPATSICLVAEGN